MRLFAGTEFDVPPKCERCQQLEEECECPPLPPTRLAPETQTAKVRVEKRKRGKIVTLIQGLCADGNDLPELLTRLKTACGAGGSIKDGVLEIQGDHATRISEQLREIGYRV